MLSEKMAAFNVDEQIALMSEERDRSLDRASLNPQSASPAQAAQQGHSPDRGETDAKRVRIKTPAPGQNSVRKKTQEKKGVSTSGGSTPRGSTPRGSRASALREKASAEKRATFERIEGSFSKPPATPRSVASAPRSMASAGKKREGLPTASTSKVGSLLAIGPEPVQSASPLARSASRPISPVKTKQGSSKGRPTGAAKIAKDGGLQGTEILKASAGEDAYVAHAHEDHHTHSPSRQENASSEEHLKAARQRLAAQESALEARRSRQAAQEVALDATRVSMQQKFDRIAEQQDTARRNEARLRKEESRFEARTSAVGKEKEHMQDRIRVLERQLDDERSRRQAAEHTLSDKSAQLVKEQAEARRRITMLNHHLTSEKAAKTELERLLADALHTREQLQQKLKLTLRQTHLQYARREEMKKADVFQTYVESLWRDGDVGAIVEGMQRYASHAGAQKRACQALTSLAHDQTQYLVKIASAGGIETICRAMVTHHTNPGVQQQACATLLTLAFDNDNQQLIAAAGGISCILDAMDTHQTHTGVQQFACRALCRIGWWRTSLQSQIKAEGGVSRIQRATADPNGAEGTKTWGLLLLTRLERSHKENLLDSELEHLVQELEGKHYASLGIPSAFIGDSLYPPLSANIPATHHLEEIVEKTRENMEYAHRLGVFGVSSSVVPDSFIIDSELPPYKSPYF